MKLVLFGCSSVDGTPYGYDHPDIWPNKLAKDLGMQLNNCFVGSGSNAAIFRKFCEYFQNDTADLCIMFWSFYARSEVHMDETVYQITPGTTSFPGKYVDKFYANQNMDLYKQELQNKIWSVEQICQNNKIPIMQGTAFDIDFPIKYPNVWYPHSLHSLIQNHTHCGHADIGDHVLIKDKLLNFIIDRKLI